MLVALGCETPTDPTIEEYERLSEEYERVMQDATRIAERWEELPEELEVLALDTYAKRLCEPLGKYNRDMAPLSDKYKSLPEDADWFGVMSLLHEIGEVEGEFADDLESIDSRIIPTEAMAWHEGQIRWGHYAAEAAATTDWGEPLGLLTLEPAPEPPIMPVALIEATIRQCGPDVWRPDDAPTLDAYAEKVCEPLTEYLRGIEEINDRYYYLPEDAGWAERTPMLREMAVVAGDFADALESIDVVPLDARAWHEGMIRVGRYPAEALAAIDSGEPPSTWTLGPMPEFPETPEELVEAIMKHCGPDLLPEP